MKRILIFTISCFICMVCAAQQTFNFDMESHTKKVNNLIISAFDQTDTDDTYRITFKVGAQNLTVSVSLIRINASGTVRVIKQLENHTIKIADLSTDNYTKDGEEIIKLLDKKTGVNIFILNTSHKIYINNKDIYSLGQYYDLFQSYTKPLYEDSYDKPQWKTRTTKYHNAVYEKLKAALSKLNDKGNRKSGGNSSGNSTKKQSAKVTMAMQKILDLFYKPLGIDDIHTINPDKFEIFLKKNGYTYERRYGHNTSDEILYDNINFDIQESDFEKVFGVRLPLSIELYEGDNGNYRQISVVYCGNDFINSDDKENDRQNALLNADKIMRIFEEAGFEDVSSPTSGVFAEYKIPEGDIRIYRILAEFYDSPRAIKSNLTLQ